MAPARNPTTWDEYQYGTTGSHRDSVSSVGGRSVRFDEPGSPSATSGLLDVPGDGPEYEVDNNRQQGDLRRRR